MAAMKTFINLKTTGLLFFTLLFAASCNQDPIFFTIANEVAPKDPRIPGTPSSFAVSEAGGVPRLFAASMNKLYCYTGTGGWSGALNPGGKIQHLASDNTYLYALIMNDDDADNMAVRRGDGLSWWNTLPHTMGEYTSFQTMYAAPDWQTNWNNGTRKVFIGCRLKAGNSWQTGYVNSSGKIELLGTITGELTGAAFDGQDYYISTRDGIYHIPGAAPLSGSITKITGGEFEGIINLENSTDIASRPNIYTPTQTDTVIAVTRDGNLYYVDNSSSPITASAVSKFANYASGALALWRDPNSYGGWSPGALHPVPALLLTGRQDSLIYTTTSGFTYGYQECIITSGVFTSAAISPPKEPGAYPTSADNNERYKSTIGKLPVNHLYQTPFQTDSAMILFASTQKNGVWSYRNRDGEHQWNAEE